ncbi:kinase-like protein [Apiospora arundinis]
MFQALAGDADVDTEYADLPDNIIELFEFYRQFDAKLVLTHGDLSSLNMMVKGDEVVGLLDWEIARWFPPYWEYTCAKCINSQNVFWAEEVDKFLEPMPYESKMEGIRQKYFSAL